MGQYERPTIALHNGKVSKFFFFWELFFLWDVFFLGSDCGERTRRWNIKGIGLQNRWGKLREAGNLIMAAWKPPLNCDTSDLKGEADVLWSHWLHDLKHTAEIGLGYAPVTPISYTAKIMTPAWRN